MAVSNAVSAVLANHGPIPPPLAFRSFRIPARGRSSTIKFRSNQSLLSMPFYVLLEKSAGSYFICKIASLTAFAPMFSRSLRY
jgi:hypothetical protein